MPPREITEVILAKSGHLDEKLDEPTKQALTKLNHFAYGATMGLFYSAKTHPVRRNLLMVNAHFIWGISLVFVFAALHQKDQAKAQS